MKRSLIILSAIFYSSYLLALDGKALYTQKTCFTCHGDDGKKTLAPNYPKLAGQNSDYCQAQVKDIRDKKRTSGQAVLMVGMVATIKDDEIKAICDFVAALK